MLFRLLPLVLGSFAIGTETFMISGVLPTIARDLHVSPATAGSLVTIFALAYAFGSPFLTVATAALERKRLMLIALGAFAVANVLAAFAPSFYWLAAARVLLALASGAFMPTAVAFATAMHAPEQRGRAIALVYAGMTLATVVGVPIGAFVADAANWRATFLGVGVLSAIAVAGVAAILPRLDGAERTGFAERLSVLRNPDALKLLALTTLALIGPFAANTYLGVLVEATIGVGGSALAGILMVYGVMSFLGSQFGGYAADRWPRERFLLMIFVVMILAFGALAIAPTLGGAEGAAALFAGLVLWGVFGWAFPIVQQARIVSLEPALASITLSLNTSALYIGAALGASIGAATVARWQVGAVGWAAALTEVAALAWLLATSGLRAADEPASRPALATED
jgi:predicted MFS family arabinose efflux permease